MRKFASVAALAAALVPGVALAHDEAPPSGNSTPATGSTTDSNATPGSPAETPEPARLPWAGTALTTQFSANLINMLAPPSFPSVASGSPGTAVNPDCQNQSGVGGNSASCGASAGAYPTADFTFYFRPRWTFNRYFQIRGLLVGSVEMTDTGETSTTYKRQFLFSDPSVDFYFTGIPTFAGFKLNMGVRTSFPLSIASQAQSRIMGLGAVVNLARPFHHVLGGTLNLSLTGSYLHPFYNYTTPGTSVVPYDRNCGTGASGDASCTGQASGAGNVQDSLAWIASAQLEWTHFSINAIMWVSHSFAYTFPQVPGDAALVSPSNLRGSEYFIFSVEYTPNTWMGIELGYFQQRPFLTESGVYGNPIYDQYQDSRFYLGANFTLDQLYQAVSGTATPATAHASAHHTPSTF